MYILRLSIIVVLASLVFKNPIIAQNALTDSISLNGTWKFKADIYKKGMDEKWFNNPNTASWDEITVPSTWNTRNEYANYTGDAWYKQTFKIPKSQANKHIQLIFESVYNNAEVWLNGTKIGDHNLGYLAFQFNINKYIKYDVENVLVLKVNNIFKVGATWNWGGIRLPVWLTLANTTKVNYTAINAVPDLTNKTATVNLLTEFANFSTTNIPASYNIQILHKGKKVAESGMQNISNLKSNDVQKISSTISIAQEHLHLWHFEKPEMYQAVIAVYQKGKIAHSHIEAFGIRKIEVDGFKLKLNGEEIRTVGFNIVPEDRVNGNALPIERFKHMVDLMKESGANMARLSHFALSKAYLDYLDEKGIMTFEEVSLWGKDTLVNPNHPLPKLWLTKLIKQQYNHPCIIGWSVGNEIGSYKNNPMVYEYVKSAITLAKQLDPYRLAAYASNTATQQPNDAVELGDIIMINAYGNWGKAAEQVHKNFPTKLIFFSEFGADLNDENLDNSVIPIEKMMTAMRDKPYVVGASLWTFNDYRSNYWSAKSTWNTSPSENRPWGIINSVMQPKKSFYNVKNEYQPFTVKDFSIAVNDNTANVSLNVLARNLLSFPAYNINNYQLKIVAKNNEATKLNERMIMMPNLQPGDKSMLLQISTINNSKVASFTVQIIDQLGYSRYDTTIFVQKPTQPKIVGVFKDLNSCRIVFKQQHSATKYFIKYGTTNLNTISAAAQLNNFIDINDLNADETYHFQLVAENNAGTNATTEDSFRLVSNELPPIVWAVLPTPKGFFISFSSDPLDFKCEVEYGQKKGVYEKRIILGNRGGIDIPNLKANTKYFVRMRRMLQWGFASIWTQEFEVITN